MTRYLISVAILLVNMLPTLAQDKSVKPGINEPFKNPDVEKYQKTFEGESREVFVNRAKLVDTCRVKPGMVVADVGAGTGIHTRLFAKLVGEEGQVYAVDIAAKFLEHIQKTSREAGLKNVTPVLCNFDAVDLPRHSLDLAFVCDTYHHFEFPQRTLASLHRAIKPGGRLVVVDFHRIEGKSSDWTLNHVRAGQEVVENEIRAAGFKKVEEVKDLLKDNFVVIFTRTDDSPRKQIDGSKKPTVSVSPIVPGYGAVVPIPQAAERPIKGGKVVFDVTAVANDIAKPLPGMERAATLLNLAGVSGLKSDDLTVTIVLHGDATYAALDDESFRAKTGNSNPNADLIDKLQKSGVTILVCGQSLERKGLDANRVRSGVTVAASAASAVINLQARGFSYLPSH